LAAHALLPPSPAVQRLYEKAYGLGGGRMVLVAQGTREEAGGGSARGQGTSASELAAAVAALEAALGAGEGLPQLGQAGLAQAAAALEALAVAAGSSSGVPAPQAETALVQAALARLAGEAECLLPSSQAACAALAA
jgi:hypothetical protein